MANDAGEIRQVQMDTQGWLVIMDVLWEAWSREEVRTPRRAQLALYLSIIRGELGSPLTPENNRLYNGYLRRHEHKYAQQPLTPGIIRR
jgi:hypothetical protein